MKKNIILSLFALFCTTFVSAQNDNDKYARKVLLEEFTTEKCPNCPNGARQIAELLFDKDYTDNVIVVAHHAGYYFDWLTTDADESLVWFYNSYQTYAPAMMFDRYPFFTDYYSNGAGSPTPVYFMSSTADLKKYVDKRMDVEANVGFEISGMFDNEETLNVEVKGDRKKVFCDTDARITVYITEDRIPAKSQAGGSKGYKHSHVMRACSSTWGDVIKWDGDSFTFDCKFKIDPSWNKDELSIVAFVSAFDDADPTKCVVENTRSIPFSITNGIQDMNADGTEVAETAYYTLDGVRTEVKSHGMYIQKKTYTDGTVKTRKVAL